MTKKKTKKENYKIPLRIKKKISKLFKKTKKEFFAGATCRGSNGFFVSGLLRKPVFHLTGFNEIMLSWCGQVTRKKGINYYTFVITLQEAQIIRKILRDTIKNYKKHKKGKLKTKKNRKLYLGKVRWWRKPSFLLWKK